MYRYASTNLYLNYQHISHQWSHQDYSGWKKHRQELIPGTRAEWLIYEDASIYRLISLSTHLTELHNLLFTINWYLNFININWYIYRLFTIPISIAILYYRANFVLIEGYNFNIETKWNVYKGWSIEWAIKLITHSLTHSICKLASV